MTERQASDTATTQQLSNEVAMPTHRALHSKREGRVMRLLIPLPLGRSHPYTTEGDRDDPIHK